MKQAIWHDVVLAESDATIVVEGNHYFPRDAVKSEYVEESTHQTVCPWKGTANYFDVVVEGERNANAAWYYPTPKPAAQEIAGYVAFWRGVRVQ
jgi:uncharacterized protein (DUF427 family)